ncbi:MAG: FtsW/RodA/SpoVE family cell cycle protein [Phycisphaerales bacterium]|nr:FtsW/RodA/SpoVE family cell cycle protein [Phycisphaerales bacterium]
MSVSATEPGVASRGYTAKSLHEDARSLHQSRVAWWTIGWVCVASALALSIIGVMAIDTTRPDLAMKHLVHLGFGVCVAVAVAVPHYRWARRMAYPLLGISILLLVFILLPGVPEAIVRPRNGARRWISLVVTDFQPSELAKFAYVAALASYLRMRSNYRTLTGLLRPLALTFLPMGLVLIEPDLGTALLFLPTLFAMLIAAGAKIKHMLLVVVLGLSLAPMMYPLLKPHEKDRIMAMVAQLKGDDRYRDDIGFQAERAMVLVGAGGLFGAHPKEHAAALIEFNRLPEEHNDMIFAVVCCRWGLMGGLVVFGLMLSLCVSGIIVAGLSRDPFGRLVAVGLVAILFAQTTINAGMTIGLLPITGMTLPFVSQGGTSLVIAWVMVGFIVNIALRRARYLVRHSFEFDTMSSE